MKQYTLLLSRGQTGEIYLCYLLYNTHLLILYHICAKCQEFYDNFPGFRMPFMTNGGLCVHHNRDSPAMRQENAFRLRFRRKEFLNAQKSR